MSRRTFDRRFRTLTGSAPLQWLITQRVLQAQRLLETSDYSVDEVAGRCGFRSPVALRGHFRRQLGSSPASYRAAYRARRPQDETEPPAKESRTSDPAGSPGTGPGSGPGTGPGTVGAQRRGHATAMPSSSGLPSQPAPVKSDNDTFTSRIPEQPGRLRGDRDVRGRNAAMPGPRDRPVG
jgi:hypothetical protein